MTQVAGEHPPVGPLEVTSFLLELVMLTLLALAGAAMGENLVVRLAAGVLLPVIAATVWALWIAPTSHRRLANPHRLMAQVALFAVTGTLAGFLIAHWVGLGFFVLATLVFGELARRERA